MTPRHVVATVLFVDVVASTERALELGNRRWHELLRRYGAAARRAARRFGGRDAGSAGDGLLFTFPQPAQALHAALAIRRAVGDLGLEVRAGVHMGEIEGSGRELGGFALHAGARVTEKAEPGEVLVSATVREALVGSGIGFTDRGTHVLKGIPGEWRLFAVTDPLPGNEPSAGTDRRRMWQTSAAVALASLVLLAAAWWLARDGTPSSADRQAAPVADRGESGDRGLGGGIASATAVAVLPFAVRGSADVGYLGEGMVDLLSTKLDGAGALRSVDPRAVLALARESGYAGEPDEAATLAGELGADLYVMGSVLEAGGRLQLDVRLYDRRRGEEAVANGAVEGEAERLFELVDYCIARLLAGVAGGPEARVTRLAAVTTNSLPALKSYLDGERALRHGEFRAALDAFASATATDTTFALAWYKLSIAAEWSATLGEERRAAADRALRHSSRLSERDRELLEAFVVYRRGDAVDSERRYRAILATYPDDLEAWHQLGETLFHFAFLTGRSISTSRSAWERVLAGDPDNLLALTHLARVAAVEGAPDEMDSLIERIERLSPEGDRLAEMLALRASVDGDAEDRERALEAVRQASDQAAYFAVWNVTSYAQDLGGALRLADAMTEASRSTEARALGHTLAAYLELARGRVRAARERLDAAAALDSVLALEHRALLASLPFLPVDEREVQGLRGRLAELDAAAVPAHVTQAQWFTAHDDVHVMLRLYLLGLLAQRVGDLDQTSVAAAEIAALEVPQGQAAVLAENLAASLEAEVAAGEGMAERAVAQLTGLKPIAYDIRLASPFYSETRERYRLAELLERRGQDEDAAAQYRSFREHTVYEVPYWAPADLALGRIYERLADPERAAEHYRRVVDLWRDCDPELQPLVDEARGRLERLRSSAPGTNPELSAQVRDSN